MYLKKYIEILRRLKNNPIIDPTDEDMARMCPHLTKEEAVKAFRNGNFGTFDSTYVACPSLKVRGAFQIVSFTGAVGGRPAKLGWAFTGRTGCGPEYPFTEQAIKFAEENWGKYLIDDTWLEVAEIRIMDPTDLVKGELYPGGVPKTVMTIIAVMNKRSEKMSFDHSRPRSELFDETIIEMSVDPLISEELKNGRGPYTYHFCGYCGSGFEASYCPGCDHGFEGGYFENYASRMSLPSKLADFAMKNGHVFKKDPGIARDIEKKGFMKNEYYYWRD